MPMHLFNLVDQFKIRFTKSTYTNLVHNFLLGFIYIFAVTELIRISLA